MASAVAALEIAPPAASLSRWPAAIEFVLAVAAVATLLPFFSRFDAIEGRDGRFAGTAIAVAGLPERVLPSVCGTHGASAEPALRDRLCRRSELRATAAAPEAIPRALIDAFAQAGRAFLRPLADAERRRGELRLQQREGLGDLLSLGNAIESIDADLQPYVERYALGRSESGAPLPLACSFEMVKRLGSNAALTSERGDSTAANAVLLLAAALDGHGATQGLSRLALLPASLRGAGRGCAGMALPDALAEASALMADARQAQILAAKNEAMHELLRTAGWQWAGWMILGLTLIMLSRRQHWALKGVALSLVVWAIAAWIGRVPWPFGVDRAFEPARTSGWLLVAPHPFVWWLLGAAVAALMLSGALQRRMPSAPQTMASRIGYPGLVMATGIGWLLLLDLSANGNPSNRYLALYHQGHLWLGMLTLSVVAFLRQPIGRALAWTLSMIDALATSLRRAIG